jgi:hypothetical protein
MLTLLIAAVSAFEITSMVKGKQFREIVAFAVIALLSLGMGVYYILTPHEKSLIIYILEFFGIHF